MLRMFWIVMAWAFSAQMTGAQDRYADRVFGGWTLGCAVDGMTDQVRCNLSAFDRAGDRQTVALMWREAGAESGVRLVGLGGIVLRNALVRIDRTLPAAFGNCDAEGRVCMASITDDKRLAGLLAAGAAQVLVRLGGANGHRDFVIPVHGLAEGRAEASILADALGEKPITRPLDALEARVAEADRRRAAADEQARRARTQVADRDRRVTAACSDVSPAHRDECATLARECAVRDQDIVACVSPVMSRRRLYAHMEEARQSCHARPEVDKPPCLRAWANCMAVDSPAQFDSCFAPAR
jgi:hypothetical protein